MVSDRQRYAESEQRKGNVKCKRQNGKLFIYKFSRFMRYTGPKNRISRRENMDLGLKTPGSKSHASLLKKLNILPGEHGTKSKRKTSEHGKQLREKQKLRFIYGVSEKTLKNYYAHAIKKTGNTGLYISQYLENRIDNVVYRLGFVPTRAAARQLVAHKHIKVNNKVMSIPSYQVKKDDVITLAKAVTAAIPVVETFLNKKGIIIPPWLEKQGAAGKLIDLPTAEYAEKQVNLRLVIEFYSR